MPYFDILVVGCGLSGAVIARELAEQGNKVCVIERRNHIGGNMYDYVDDNGCLVSLYGPHTFHTKKKELYEYMCRYGKWQDFKLTCGAVINGKYTPTPFNFKSIDVFFDGEKAKKIKDAIKYEYPNKDTASITELMNHKNLLIKEYAWFLFKNDYCLYTAKQWGISPKEIDPVVLERVPVRFNYEIGYFDDDFQVMPTTSFTDFFHNLLTHSNIEVHLNVNALEWIFLDEQTYNIFIQGKKFNGKVFFTGAIDELFGYKYGKLPYRSLRFEWKFANKKSFQEAPVVAYPQVKDFTRITEYTKIPVQDIGEKTVYAVEYSLPYEVGESMEPYYPVLTGESKNMYERYKRESKRYSKLIVCGRLGDFKYYNMDQALERALNVLEHNR